MSHGHTLILLVIGGQLLATRARRHWRGKAHYITSHRITAAQIYKTKKLMTLDLTIRGNITYIHNGCHERCYDLIRFSSFKPFGNTSEGIS